MAESDPVNAPARRTLDVPRLVVTIVRIVGLVIAGAWGGTWGAGVAMAQVSSAIAITERAEELERQGQLEEAVRYYERALALDPENEGAYLRLSATLHRMKRHEQALERLAEAQAHLGPTPRVMAQRGIHLAALKRWVEAKTVLEAVLVLDPSAYDAALYLGEVYLQSADWTRAVSVLGVYLAHRPASLAKGDIEVRVTICKALMRAGQLAAAEKELSQILGAQPRRTDALVLQVTLLAKSGRCRRALDIIKGLPDPALRSSPVLYHRALCYYTLGQHEQALSVLDDYQARSPDTGAGAELRAQLYERVGREKEAVLHYRRALAHGVHVEGKLGTLLVKLGQAKEAAQLLWAAVETGSTDAALLLVAGDTLLSLGDTAKALAIGDRLATLRPGDAQAHRLKGRAELAADRYSAAETSLKRSLTLEPTDKTTAGWYRLALEHRAKELAEAGQREDAEQRLLEAYSVDPTPTVAYNLALLMLARHAPKQAIAVLEPVWQRIEPPDAARYVLGRAYLEAGEATRARETLEPLASGAGVDAPLKLQGKLLLLAILQGSDPEAALHGLVELRTDAADTAELRDELEREIAQARLALAEAQLANGRPEETRKQVQAALGAGSLPATTALRGRIDLALAVLAKDGFRAGGESLATLLADPGSTGLLAARPHDLGPSGLALYGAFLALESTPAAKYPTLLQAHGALLGSAAHDDPPLLELLVAFVEKIAYLVAHKRDVALARRLAKDVPSELRSPAFQHNLLLAGGFHLKPAALPLLEALAPRVPEAYVNLARIAELLGDHRRALVFLHRAQEARVNLSGLAEWLAAKERVYGAP
jgi:tetratricopeptide (TPR) repeat protein